MKKRFLIFLMTLVFAMSIFTSCMGGKKPDTDGGEENPGENDSDGEENFIYNSKSELYFIVAEGVTSEKVTSLFDEVCYNRLVPVLDAPVDSELHSHEIVVGDTGREISNTAISRLGRVNKNSADELAFLIYSDGSSVAIVWEEGPYDDDKVMETLAIDYFKDNYVSGESELVLDSGVVYSETLELAEDYYREIDTAYKKEAWETFEKKYGKELTDAYKSLYAIYSPDCIIWLANLYDPDICVCVDLYGEEECSGTKYCGTGGWYYSNSARDNYGYLPDAESTNQALNFLTSAGLAYMRDGTYLNVITDEMKEQISNFVYALEEPNGYFYHPQWGIEFTDSKISRRARDLSWCEGMLKNFKRTPKYTTASGMVGENPRQVSSSNLPGKLGSAVLSVSKVMAASDEIYVSYLQDINTFKAYLNSKDLRNSSYSVGNELTATVPQIQERDRQIGTPDNPTPLMDFLIEWLNEGQNPETGNWDWKKPGDAGYKDYYGTNGLLKISGVYQKHKVVIPYAKEACLSAMADIINPAQIGAVVDLYNTWFAIQNVFENLISCGGEEGKALVEEIQGELRAMAPEALAVSRDKIYDFLKPDGSASYGRMYSSSTSQGCPAAVPNSIEGDVNGSTIAINGIIGHSASALGITKIPTFGEAERYLFRKTIKELSPVTKIQNGIVTDPLTFDHDYVGEPSADLTYSDSNPGTGLVVADPTGAGKGNVIEMISPSATIGDSIKVPVSGTVSSLDSCYIFEGEFNLAETSTVYPIQISLGGCYMLTFRTVTGNSGEIRLVGSSSGTDKQSMDEYLGVTVNKNEWFKIRIEYYKGNADTVRIKFYADTDLTDDDDTLKLYSVSDNYYDSLGTKITTGTSTPSSSFTYTNIFILSATKARLYFDNVISYTSKQAYTPPVSDEGLYYNVDSKDTEEKIYNFESGALPEDFDIEVATGDVNSIKVDSGKLAMSGSDKTSLVKIPLNVRTAGAKCASTIFDITYSEAAASGSNVFAVTGIDNDYDKVSGNIASVFSFAFKALEDGDGKYLALVSNVGKSANPIEGIRVALGESISIKMNYYHKEGVSILYVKNAEGKFEFIGACTDMFDNGKKYTIDTIKLSTFAGVAGKVSLDNLVVEMTADTFLDAVAPEIPEKIYDFETNSTDIILSASSIKSYGGDNAVMLKNKGASITVPVNKRSNLTNALVFDISLDFTILPASGDTHTLSLLDAEGNVIFAMTISVLDGEIALYEVGKGGRLPSPICTFKTDKTVGIKLEVFNSNRIINIKKADGTIVGKSSVFAGSEFMENSYAYAKLVSLDSKTTVYVDDIRCESIYSIYNVIHVSSAMNNPEKDYTSGITFENSNSGSLPSSIFVSNNGNNFVSVENVKNEITNEYSNTLVLNKYDVGNDSIGFVSGIDTTNANSVVFEADMKINCDSDNVLFRMYFGENEKRQNPMYMINIGKSSGGKITFEDISSDQSDAIRNSFGANNVNNGDWFKLRVELYKGGKDTVRFKVFINDQLVHVSNNYIGAHKSTDPASLPKTLSIYCMGAMKATVYFDNVKFYTSSATCTDAVTTK